MHARLSALSTLSTIALVFMGALLLGSFVVLTSCGLTHVPAPSITPAASIVLLSSPSQSRATITLELTATATPALSKTTAATPIWPSPRPSTTTRPTRTPTPTPSPTATGDLGQFFVPPWSGDPFVNPPQWMEEPPGDRQVVREGEWHSPTLSLLDNQGTLLARFTRLESSEARPHDVLWSPSKDRAVVVFGFESTWMLFMLIDRDGNRLNDIIHGYWFPVWSPTQDLVAFEGIQAGENRLCIIDGNGRFLAAGSPLSPRMCMSCSDLPQWSPNGTCAAVTVVIGDVTGTSESYDNFLAVACADGALFHIKLRDYDLNDGHLHWLDDAHILVRGNPWWQSDIVRYLLLDLETGTIREVSSSMDLTPTPSLVNP